jgi:MAM domain protein
MRRNVLVVLLLGSLLNAQQGNDKLKKEMDERRKQLFKQFEFYAQKEIYRNNSTENPKPESVIKQDLKKERETISFFVEGIPYFLKAYDTDQIKNSNVDAIQEGTIDGLTGSFNGEGIKVSVFDGGRVYAQHQDFGNSTRITNKEASTIPYDSHATGVTGMIGGEGKNVSTRTGVFVGNTKGMMPKATFDSYYFGVTTLLGETEEKNVSAKIRDSKPALSNHSYGNVIGWTWDSGSWYWSGGYSPASGESADLNGTYYVRDKELDDIVYNNSFMVVVKSAGNSFGDGPSGNPNGAFYRRNNVWTQFDLTMNPPENNCASGYDCIPTGAVAKNIITVGATEKITHNNGRYIQASDVVKADYSSAGPRDDGAIKPDIAGVGSSVVSPSTSATGSDSYQMGNGTSFSAPQVTGILGLWSQIYQSLFAGQNLNAASAKNLLIHTAQEAGNIGPDVWYGWGFVDAKKGAELLVQKKQNKVIFEDKELKNAKKNEILVKTDGSQPLKATIVWTDPSYKDVNYNTYDKLYNIRESKLVNDLDLRITNIQTNEVYYPWKLDVNAPRNPAIKGDNTVDNVEQVLIDQPTAGIYKIEVSNKGTLVNNDGVNAEKQTYSMIVTGHTGILTPSTTTPVEASPTLLADGNNIVNVKFVEKINDIKIFDMSGRLVRSVTPSLWFHDVDFSGLPVGIYVLTASSANHKLSKKIRKQ